MATTISSSTGLSEKVALTKILLTCGILSSVHYVLINIFVPLQFEGYSIASQTISELSAIGAPTRSLWVPLGMVYVLLFAAFGWGVVKAAGDNRHVRIIGWLMIAYSVVNVYWPPMHLRGAEPTLTDTLHIVWAVIENVFVIAMLVIGAAASGKRFRHYTVITIILLIGFGILTGLDAPKLAANLPTPWLGIWERIVIGLFLLWIAVLAVMLLRKVNAEK